MSYLVLERLCRRFGSYLAVNEMSLAVDKGSFISLLGPSGCGKTTSLQMIAGFIQPTTGAIRLESQDLLQIKPNRRGLGIVFQSYALFPHMTAAENIAFGLEMLRLPRSERDRRVQEALKLVGLEGFADRHPRRMSGGQQQRVALARALAIKPRILLLDEPLSNLDAKLREEMQIELRQIQRTVGATTILVTHDQAEALALSDRIVVMNNGRIEQVGEPHEVYEQPASAFVASFLGKTNLLPARTLRIGEHVLTAIGDGRWPTSHASGDEITVSVRPEKIRFVESGAGSIGGAIRTRIFQGSYWLYQVDTPCGLVTVIRQNSGEVAPKEGETVRLSWRAEDMTPRPMAGGAR